MAFKTFLAGAALACSFAATAHADPAVTDSTLTIDGTGDAQSVFQPKVPKITLGIATSDVAIGQTITTKWVGENIQEMKPNTEIATIELASKGKTASFTLNVNPAEVPDGLPEGEYRVDVLVDGKKLTSMPFTVDASKKRQPHFGGFDFSAPDSKDGQTSFAPKVPKITLTIGTMDMKPDTKLTSKWIATKAEGLDANQSIAEVATDAGTTHTADFTLHIDPKDIPDGLPVGDYRVDMLIDGQPAKSAPFKIVK